MPTDPENPTARRSLNAEQWNEQYKIGTRVAAYPITRDSEPLITRTRSEAWELSHGRAVVAVVGKTGGIALTHIDVIEDTPMTADDLAAQALSDAGAFCGQCGFEPGQRGCPDCERVWANYVAVLRAAGWAPRTEIAADLHRAQQPSFPKTEAAELAMKTTRAIYIRLVEMGSDAPYYVAREDEAR